MGISIIVALFVCVITIQVKEHRTYKITKSDLNLSKINTVETTTATPTTTKTATNSIDGVEDSYEKIKESTISITTMMTSKTDAESSSATRKCTGTSFPFAKTVTKKNKSSLPSLYPKSYSSAEIQPAIKKMSSASTPYCTPSLCEFYNGSHTNVKPHIACKNSGNFGAACGLQPHLLKMSERRRNLILDLHNLARSRIASGQVDGYKPASHMPQLKWDNELEFLASLHVKRCKFEHDLCHNTLLFPYTGQNIGYFWKAANITSHSKRIKNFIVDWFNEHKDANQTFIDSFRLHPEK